MKKVLLSLVAVVCLSLPAFADAKAVKQVVTDLNQKIVSGNIQDIPKYYHNKYTGSDARGKKTTIKDIYNFVAMYKRFARAIAPNSKLMDIVEFYAFIRRKPMSDEDRKNVLAIQDSETGKTRADALRKELKQIWDAQLQKRAAAWKTHKIVSVTVSGRKAVLVLEMASVKTGKMEVNEFELVKYRNTWLIIKSVTKPAKSVK